MGASMGGGRANQISVAPSGYLEEMRNIYKLFVKELVILKNSPYILSTLLNNTKIGKNSL
jgi:hypothetical protein